MVSNFESTESNNTVVLLVASRRHENNEIEKNQIDNNEHFFKTNLSCSVSGLFSLMIQLPLDHNLYLIYHLCDSSIGDM